MDVFHTPSLPLFRTTFPPYIHPPHRMCLFFFLRQYTLRLELKRRWKPSIFRALDSGRRFLMRRIMAAALACPLCLHQGFSHPNQLIQLMLDFLQRPLSCPICGCQASNVSELSKHLVQHSLAFQQQALQFHCKQNGCLFSSTDLAALRLHVESEHPERKYLCVHCCKLFKGTRRNLILIRSVLLTCFFGV